MLHSALDLAVKERLLIRNPADSCVVPKVQHQEMKTLQPEDLNIVEKTISVSKQATRQKQDEASMTRRNRMAQVR